MRTPSRQIASATHYEQLSRYQSRFVLPGVRRKDTDWAIHRRMQPAPAWTLENSGVAPSMYLYDRLFTTAAARPGCVVLDVGCGFGAGTVRMAQLGAGSSIGVTNSASQVARARELALACGLQHQCRFMHGDFNEPAAKQVDLIIAVESLIHAKDLGQTMRTLSRQLRPGGRLAIVDDVAVGMTALQVRPSIGRGWAIDRIWCRADYLQSLADTNLDLVVDEDWTSDVEILNPALQIAASTLLCALDVTVLRKSNVVRFHRAQLALHGLYRNGQLCYRALIAQRT